jgi:integrase
MKEKYLKLSGGRWRYRRPVPEPLQKIIGKLEITCVLGKPDMDPLVAAQKCRAYNEGVERQFALARAGTLSQVDHTATNLAQMEARKLAYEVERNDPEDGSWLTVTLLQEKAEAAYIKDGLKNGRKRSELAWDVNMADNRAELFAPFLAVSEKLLIEELAGRRDPRSLTLSKCLPLANQWSPVSDTKARSTAVDQFIEAIGDKAITDINRKDVHAFIAWLRSERHQGKKTIERRLSALSRIVVVVADMEDLDLKNPFKGHIVPRQDDDETTRVPFHKTHLKLINQHVEASTRMKWETKAILLLLMYTGCRPSEIGGMLKEDFVIDDDVPHIWIRKNSYRTLKTIESKRHIPLCGPALVVAKEVIEKGPDAGPVFGEKACNTNSLSARLKRAIRLAGVPRSPNRLVPYSFRHSFKQALDKAQVYEPMVERLMGHTPKTVTQSYGSPVDQLEDLVVAVEKALGVLGEVDESVYLGSELVKHSNWRHGS